MFSRAKFYLNYIYILGATNKDEEQIDGRLTIDNKRPSTAALNSSISPAITRSLRPVHRYCPGEQLHFLVEYISPSDQCHCTWQVQYCNENKLRPIESGFIVNADCSSILIIESITSELQGLYIFCVENMHGRAITETIVTVDADSIRNGTQS